MSPSSDVPADRYIRRSVLGEGAVGKVWLAEDSHQKGRLIALKEQAEPGREPSRHEDSFRREFALLARIRHPSLPEVREFDRDPGTGLPRFTLEYVRGARVTEAVRAEGPSLVPRVAVESLRALAVLHDLGFVHGDLKPENVLVRESPKLGRRVVLLDLGLAGGLEAPGTATPARGTVPFMAPELFRNEPPSPRSDLYALGVTIHVALFGVPPIEWIGGDLNQFLARVLESDRRILPVPEGCPVGLTLWIEQLLAANPSERPGSAPEALARLDEACGSSTPLETPLDRAARLLSGRPSERSEAISRIESWLTDSRGPTLVLVSGPPGSGKTRLLRWLESEAILRGWDVAPIIDADGGRIEALLSRRGPRTLALVDEVDTAAVGAAEALQRLAATADPGTVRVVAAVRPGRIRQPAVLGLMEAGRRGWPVARIDLDRLTASQIRSMATRATGKQISDEHVRWLEETSGGSAAFVEALLVEGTWERASPAAKEIASLALPLGRLSILSPGALRWMEWTCVSQGELPDEALADLAGVTRAEGLAASEELVAAGLTVRRDGRLAPESRALADRVLDSMEPARRRESHSRAAELVRATRGEETNPWLLARLTAESGAHELAARLAEAAATRSEEAGDPAEASVRWSFAVHWAGRDRRRRFGLRLRQGNAYVIAGLHDEASRAFRAATRLAKDERERTEAMARQADALAQAGKFDLALVTAEEVEGRTRSAGMENVRALARKTRGVVLARLGREREALPLLEEAVALLRDAGVPGREAEALHALAACKLRLRRDDAEVDFRAALERYEAARHLGALPTESADLKAGVGLAVVRARAGHLDEADAILDTVRRDAAARGNLRMEEAALSRLAAHAVDLCRLDRAMTLAAHAADLSTRLGEPNVLLVNRARLADAMVRCGRAGDAVAILREALEGDLDQVEPDNVDYARMLLAGAWVETGRTDDTPRRLLESCLEGCRRRRGHRTWAMALVFELERRVAGGAVEPAEPVLQELESVSQAGPEPPDAEIVVRSALARSQERLARGDPAAAERAAEEAARAADGAGFVAYGARARALRAKALERLGRFHEANRSRSEGRTLLDRAAARIADESVRSGFLSRPVYAPLREEEGSSVTGENRRLAALYEMIRTLNSESDPDALVETILDLALQASRATRGMILLRDEGEREAGEFAVRYARNLEAETLHDAETYSRSIVQAAGAGQSLLVLDAGADERFRDVRSVSLFGIRSLMCVPLRSHDRIVGTVYLDGREEGELFTPDDLRFVEAFADHAALALENVKVRARLEQRARDLQAAAESRTEFANLVGRSPGMQKVFDLIGRVAATDLPVLILGESGTGKELVARAVHFQGPRRRRTFLTENCAALPESLLESELFGHVRGAFTGAEKTRAGLFEQADGGTLFLDEVGDMSPGMQARLLRVLENGEVRRVGADRPIHVRVRLLAATNRDLAAEVERGRFRQDLFYRLQVLSIELPPLRDRPGDIALLAERFLHTFAQERGKPAVALDDDVLDLLERHAWPGNVRELQNMLRRLSVVATGSRISLETVASDPALSALLLPLVSDRHRSALTLEAGEKEQIRKALAAADGNRSRAARLLGVSRATLYRKLQFHQIR